MTKKELTLNAAAPARRTLHLSQRIENSRILLRLAALYSRLLEEPVTPRRTLRLLHAQLAALTLLMMGTPSLLLGMLLLAWTALAVWQCRK